MKAELQLDIDSIVKQTVEVALAEALNKDGGRVVQNLVKLALSEKADKYSSETILQASLRQCIKDVARERVKAWVLEHMDAIKAEIGIRLENILTGSRIADNLRHALEHFQI